MRAALVCFALCLGGCAAQSGTRPTPSASPVTEMAPTPYTADQIREASPAGRRYEWTHEEKGKPTTRRVVTFREVDGASAELETTVLDETGHTTGEAQRKRATGVELRDHASFPRQSVVISDETITVPAGTFDCRLYTVTGGEVVSRFWFAKTLPGAPVRLVTTKGGEVVESRTLVRYLAK